MFVVLSTGFAYCVWNRADYLIRPTGCLLLLMKTGNSFGQRRYENSCVKLAFTLYGYSKALETSNHFLYVFKQRLLDMFTQEWTSDIRDKERYEMYRSFKVMFGADFFLSVIDIYCFRVALT